MKTWTQAVASSANEFIPRNPAVCLAHKLGGTGEGQHDLRPPQAHNAGCRNPAASACPITAVLRYLATRA